MKSTFSANLSGKDLFNKVLLPLIIFTLITVLTYVKPAFQADTIIAMIDSGKFPTLFFLLYLIQTCAYLVIHFECAVATINSLKFKDKKFECTSHLGEFIKVAGVGYLLSLVTFGIYLPWCITKIYRYIMEHTHRNGKSGGFYGTGLQLLGYILMPALFMGLFLLVLVPLHAISPIIGVWATFLVYFALLAIFLHLFMVWALRVTFGSYTLTWNKPTGEAILFWVGQVLLLCLTLGLYLSWFYLRVAEYYLNKSTLLEGERDSVRKLSFQSEPGDGLFLLGQIFLTVITFGIYVPFATAQVVNRLAPRLSVTEPDVIESPVDPAPTADPGFYAD